MFRKNQSDVKYKGRPLSYYGPGWGAAGAAVGAAAGAAIGASSAPPALCYRNGVPTYCTVP